MFWLQFSRLCMIYFGLLVRLEKVYLLSNNFITVLSLFFLTVAHIGILNILNTAFLLWRLKSFALKLEHPPIFFRQFQKLNLRDNLLFWEIEVPRHGRLLPLYPHFCLLLIGARVYNCHRHLRAEELMIQNRLYSDLFILSAPETQVHELWEQRREVKQLYDARHCSLLKTFLHSVEEGVPCCSHLPHCKFKHDAPELVKVCLDSRFERILLLEGLLTTQLGANLS